MPSPPDTAVISVTTANHFHRARALMRDVARHLPDAARIVCCVDPLDGPVDPAAEGFTVVDAAALGLPRFRHLAFALNATGMCCALKPYVALHALAAGARRAIYLDNDIQIFRKPGEMLAALDRHSFVLTPHLLEPVAPGVQPDDATVLAFGIFNAGMFGATNAAESREFLAWWGSRTADPATMLQTTGYDQIWLNFAPTFLADAAVLRDEGYNVAAWNLAARRLGRNGEGFRAGAAPLTTFHFSSFDEAHPDRLFNPHVRCNYPTGPLEAGLAQGYAASLTAAGSAQFRGRPYGFATFRDGRPISQMQRRLFALECWNETPPDADPFDPEFETARFHGGRRLHRYHDFSARAARGLTRAWRSVAGG